MANIRKRGNKWQVQVRRKGNTPLSKTFISRKDADIWARQMELQMDRRELPQDPRALDAITLGDLVRRYRDTATPMKRAARGEAIVLNAFLRHPICSKTMKELTLADFNVYRDERLKEVKARSVQRMLSPVQNLFEVARTEWGLPIKENLVSKVKFVLISNRRERRLMAGEFEVLLAAAKKTQNPFVLPMVLLALQTGLRRSELLAVIPEGRGCREAMPDRPGVQERASAHHSPDQGSCGHHTEAAEDRGQALPVGHENAFRLAWERLVKRSGLPDPHFHDLRHEAISRFFELGLSAPEVALISGYRDMRMLFRHTHPNRQRILEMLDHERSTVTK